jgi:L-asparaginase II
MSNPILVELTRGRLVESVHTGALAIARPNGEIVVALGDIQRLVFPRSAVKALQALPLIESGAADHFGFGNAEIALACSSHSGTHRHTTVARGMLDRAGLTPDALGCGAHDPVHETTARQMFAAGDKPSALHNNCSGKHAGMLATCVHCGDAPAGYFKPDHPHQQRILKVLAEVSGAPVTAEWVAVDGCSAPNWPMAVRDMARAFARFVTGDGLPLERAKAARRIADACWAEPELVAGPGRLDTTAMTKLGKRVFMKTGAEGVYCGGIPDLGLGFALKIDDGNKRASEAIVEGLLQRCIPDAKNLGALGPITNWRGLEVGETRLASACVRALEPMASVRA